MRLTERIRRKWYVILIGLVLAAALAAGILWVLLRFWTKKSDITLGVDRSVSYRSGDEITQAKERYTVSPHAGIKASDKEADEDQVAIVFDRLSETPVNEKILKVLEEHGAKATFSVPGVEAAENDEFLASLSLTDHEIAGNTLEEAANKPSEGIGKLIEKLCMTKTVLAGLTDREVKGVFLSGTGYSGSVLKAVKACGFDYVIEPDNADLIDISTFKNREGVKKYVSSLSGKTIIMIELNGLADAIMEEVPVYPDVPAKDKMPDAEDEEKEEEEEAPELPEILDWLLSELDEREIKTEPVSSFETKSFKDTESDSLTKAPVYTGMITDRAVAGLAFCGLPFENAQEVTESLKRAKAGATFFVTAEEAEKNRQTVDELRQSGFYVATAGKTGQDMTGRNTEECYREIEEGLEGIADLDSLASSCYMPHIDIASKENLKAEDLFGQKMDSLRRACTANGVRLIYPLSVTKPRKGDIETIEVDKGKVDINELEAFIQAAKDERLKVISVDDLLEAGGKITPYTEDEIRDLRRENGGNTAEAISFVQTVRPAVALEFYGLPETATLDEILSGLERRKAGATFYVTYEDMTSRPEQVEKIVLAGKELGIAYRETRSCPQEFETILRYLNSCSQYMEWRFGVKPSLVLMPTGRPEKEMREAVSAAGYDLAGFNFNFSSGKLAEMADEDVSVKAAIYDKIRVSLGSALLFRPDYYENLKDYAELSQNSISENDAAAFIEEILKTQVDPIAFYPAGEEEPEKGSEYELLSMSGLMRADGTYETAENSQDIIKLENRILRSMDTEEEQTDYMAERYLGNPSVLTTGEFPGFTGQEIKKFDKDGIITEDKKLFLTFDDWGTDRSLNKLLYVLKKHNVKATFFVITKNIKDNPNLLRRIGEEGHEIATHTHSHYSFAIESPGKGVKYEDLSPSQNRALRNDIVISYDTLIKYAGDIKVNGRPAVSKNLRPPTLAVSKSGLTTMFDVGFANCVLGSFSTHDYEAKSAEELVNKLRKGIVSWNRRVTAKNGAVIIMHMTENAAYTAQALDIMIPEWKDQGFEFARIDDYLK